MLARVGCYQTLARTSPRPVHPSVSSPRMRRKLYVGGGFTLLSDGTSANCVAVWDGTAWSALGTSPSPANGFNTVVNALLEYNGKLYAGGGFSTFANGTVRGERERHVRVRAQAISPQQ